MTDQTTLANESKRLIQHLVRGDVEGVRALYSGPADIDDPFAGHQVDGGFERMVTDWHPVKGAKVTSLEVVHSTAASGFVGTEVDLGLERNGETTTLSIVVVSAIDADSAFTKTRLYYRRANIDGEQHFRDRMLDGEIDFDFDPIIAKYQKALLERRLDDFLSTFAQDGYFDGHGGPEGERDGLVDLRLGKGMGVYRGHDELRQGLGQMFEIADEEGPEGRLEHVNAFSDGVTTVLEFNILRPDQNHVHAGVACYELNGDGLIKAARVYDEAW